MRDLIIDLRVGGGSVPEIAHGIVRIWGTEVRPNATSLVLTTETTLKLSEGKATLANAQTSGTGPLYEWAYIIQVEPFHGRNYRFYVAIPDGTGPINLVDLPKLNPITGEGFYLDIEEWEALYGDLPNRVDALETSQGTQDTKITALEARPVGNTTMRVDTTVGTRVFITDGVTERMVSGDTGRRGYVNGLTVGDRTPYVSHLSRVDNLVTLYLYANPNLVGAEASFPGWIPPGFRPLEDMLLATVPEGGTPPVGAKVKLSKNGSISTECVYIGRLLKAELSWTTRDPWPTTLPGTPA